MELNENQRKAVEYLEGPLLVLAGPGTGKTQLLSRKVEHILKNTDTAPENILCLTFTESGASNMRERLKSTFGKEGAKVNIGTYHAFGQEILAQYKAYSPEYTRVLNSVIDDLNKYKIIRDLQEKLPPRDILSGDSISNINQTISDAKQAGLTADDLLKIAEQNAADSEVLSESISPLLKNAVPRNYERTLNEAYMPIYELLKNYAEGEIIVKNIERTISGMARDLEAAINDAEAIQKSEPLRKWRDKYFDKNAEGEFVMNDKVANLKLKSLAKVMREYEEYLRGEGLYDYDDMILEAMKVLSSDLGFKETLQEKYQFIMLDEFQDTNPTQLNIVKLLTDYEKPMIMAVGDDDQTIYEFQGANATNLEDFQKHYNAEVITLTENYRSTQEILDFSKHVIEQATDRFVSDKPLTAHLPAPKKSQIERYEFLSSDLEYEFIAGKIAEMIKAGVRQKEIAIISNKHKYFMPLLPFLKARPEIKIAYEKRDNLLEDEKIHELLTILKLAEEIAEEKRVSVSLLEVLTYSWMGVPAMEVLKLLGEARQAHEPVFSYLLRAETSPEVTAATEFIVDLSARVLTEPIEMIFQKMTEKMKVSSLPPYEMFRFYENLAAMRSKLIKHYGEKPLRVRDLIEMTEDYEAAGMAMTVSSPYRDADDAVQVLTAHKSKGLEFSYVFILSADHTAWGKGKGNNNLLVLPKNLTRIRHTGVTDGEKLRVLYVALTRAKHTLIITNSLYDFNGKSPERLEYFEEYVEKGEDKKEQVVSPFLPDKYVKVGAYEFSGNRGEAERIATYLSPYVAGAPDMRGIYRERVKEYRMSPSSLTSFINLRYAGPEAFFRQQILYADREPEGESMALGNLAHAVYEQVTNSGISDEAAVELYLAELDKKDLPFDIKERIRKVGPEEILTSLREFQSIIRQGKGEVNLSPEHLIIEGVPVTGKIDHLVIDEDTKTIEVYDYKTGKYSTKGWDADLSFYEYKLQLGFYKLLLNHSPVYAKYKVERGHILFVRPDKVTGKVYDKVYEFSSEDETELLALMKAVYAEVSSLRFMDEPEIFRPADKNATVKEVKEFVKKLINTNDF